ncbi:dodecin [Anaeromyxobacter terrae]|nr:dodecin [Anaeromyxobacter sp. SG22]
MVPASLTRGGDAPPDEEPRMSGVYKKIEIVGTSPTGFDEATRAAIEEASKSIRHMAWFEVAEQRGAIKGGKITEFQVTLRVGFKLE